MGSQALRGTLGSTSHRGFKPADVCDVQAVVVHGSKVSQPPTRATAFDGLASQSGYVREQLERARGPKGIERSSFGLSQLAG